MHSLRKTLEAAQEALENAGVAYALIGGLALGGRGVHRATMDVDLLVDGKKRDVAKAALEKAGFELRVETEEVLHFLGPGALDVLLANRIPTQKMLERAQPLKSLKVNCVRAEDIIGLKIQAYINDPKRELQDKADIQALIEKNPDLDWTLIREYADLFDEWPTLEQLRQKLL
jgi:predicted nucleotidyltransferase